MKNDRELRAALRAWDASRADAGLAADERARLRAAAVAAARTSGTRRVPGWRAGLALAAAGAAALLFAVVAARGPATETTTAAAEASPRLHSARIEFVAPGGTRIIWLAAPDGAR